MRLRDATIAGRYTRRSDSRARPDVLLPLPDTYQRPIPIQPPILTPHRLRTSAMKSAGNVGRRIKGMVQFIQGLYRRSSSSLGIIDKHLSLEGDLPLAEWDGGDVAHLPEVLRRVHIKSPLTAVISSAESPPKIPGYPRNLYIRTDLHDCRVRRTGGGGGGVGVPVRGWTAVIQSPGQSDALGYGYSGPVPIVDEKVLPLPDSYHLATPIRALIPTRLLASAHLRRVGDTGDVRGPKGLQLEFTSVGDNTLVLVIVDIAMVHSYRTHGHARILERSRGGQNEEMNTFIHRMGSLSPAIGRPGEPRSSSTKSKSSHDLSAGDIIGWTKGRSN
ncbi:hypothetical protein FB451DRAFT_1183141 [Mycena latifolia]|nr:hypothetical protein FB451DRAFT_1183141 [Mycena latifolia]